MASSIILSDNGASSGSAGIKTTGGNDGVLQLQTTTSGGTATTAISISNTQIVSFTNPPTATGAGSVSTNTAYGTSALAANTTGADNTAYGWAALLVNTSGGSNTAIGQQSLQANTTGASNTGVGRVSIYANTTGSYNVGVGEGTLRFNTTASNNTAVGYQTAYSNTTGTPIQAFGKWALYANTTGTNNDAFGFNALGSNTTGGSNVGLGTYALYSNTTASNNTAVGYQAGYANTTGTQNACFGAQAGYSQTTANRNTLIGPYAGWSTTTGSGNTFVGNAGSNNSAGAGFYVTTGQDNTIIGGYTGNQGGLDIRTQSNYIVLSDGLGTPRMWTDGSAGGRPWFNYDGASRAIFRNSHASTPYGVYVWYNAAAPNNSSFDFLLCDDASVTRAKIYSNGGFANYQANNTNLSDRREKTNFAPAKSYLDVICAIPVQTFNYIDQNLEEDDGLTLGVVAQDVQAVAPELVMESNWAKEGDEPRMRLSIYQTDLQYALMKALQELKAEIDTLKGQA